jgi:hypothetical protein
MQPRDPGPDPIQETPLATFEECKEAVNSKVATPLQQFIYDNEPAGNQDELDFRDGLLRVWQAAYSAGMTAQSEKDAKLVFGQIKADRRDVTNELLAQLAADIRKGDGE